MDWSRAVRSDQRLDRFKFSTRSRFLNEAEALMTSCRSVSYFFPRSFASWPPLNIWYPCQSCGQLHDLTPDALACLQERSVPVFAGVLIGYLMYDMQHYAIHYGAQTLWLFPQARQNHLDHHYKSPTHGFGISSGFVDLLLATTSPRSARHQSALTAWIK